IGFHFAKDSEKDEYAVTGYYYEDASDTLTIPSTHNDLPVVEIANLEIPNETEAITIPSSITNLAGLVSEIQNAENLATINYQGTKAQWEELGISNNAFTNIEINCSDDDNDDNGDNDDDFDGTFSLSIDSIDAATNAKINEAINGVLGFLYSNIDEYDFSVGCDIFLDGEDDEDALIFQINMSAENYGSCSFEIFKTEQGADAYLNYYLENLNYGNDIATKNGNAVLIESKNGLYDTIKNSTIPTDAKTQSILTFLNGALKKETNSNNSSVVFLAQSDNGNSTVCSIVGFPNSGNIQKEYTYVSAEYIIEDGGEEEFLSNFDLSQYSDDSYVQKQSDGSYIYHIKTKPGFIFEENEDKTGYIITGYYYEGTAPETLIIPSTYNNKPVVEIGVIDIPDETTAITIPSSITSFSTYTIRNLTTINYQGTKEQWKELDFHLGNVVIHCSNGDLDKDGNEI
ncbi:MAG: hypothetical protein NC303_06700, partial [Firmicutes bacterium]|nr:hypothetical protein [Bacillota bacterium]